MTIYYKKIEISNIAIIQEKALKLLDLNEAPRIFFPKIDEQFLEIEELRNNLVRLGYDLSKTGFGINVLDATEPQGNVIHHDYGFIRYGLNIPLLNCENTYVNFFHSHVPGKVTTHRTVDDVPLLAHYRYDPSTCEVADTVHTNEPYMINIKEPHNVVNTNGKTRWMLMIRNTDNKKMSAIFNS